VHQCVLVLLHQTVLTFWYGTRPPPREIYSIHDISACALSGKPDQRFGEFVVLAFTLKNNGSETKYSAAPATHTKPGKVVRDAK
jgi:acyl-CoA synthetase (AMP-forming)/AMP-acid ligase II